MPVVCSREPAGSSWRGRRRGLYADTHTAASRPGGSSEDRNRHRPNRYARIQRIAGLFTMTTDQPFTDTVAYGSGPDDNITDTAETAAVTHHKITLDGHEIAYT